MSPHDWFHMILGRPLWCRWKLLIPYLYDWFANHNLTWPSQCCRSAAMAACIASCCAPTSAGTAHLVLYL